MKYVNLSALRVLIATMFLVTFASGAAESGPDFTDLNADLATFQASLSDGNSSEAAHKVAMDMIKIKKEYKNKVTFKFDPSHLSDQAVAKKLTELYSKQSQQAGIGGAVGSTLAACALVIGMTVGSCNLSNKPLPMAPAVYDSQSTGSAK